MGAEVNTHEHFSEELGYELDLRYSSEAANDVRLFGNKRDPEIIISRSKKFIGREEPSVGDFVIMLDGEKRRLTHDWGDSLQTTWGADSGNSDSFYLLDDGNVSYSGSLDPSIPKNKMTLTGYGVARFWCFHNNVARAHSGMSFWCKVRVWKVNQ